MSEVARLTDAYAASAVSLSEASGSRITKGELVKRGASWLADLVLRAARDNPKFLDQLCRDMRKAPAAASDHALADGSGEPHMVGESPQMRAVFDVIRRFAPTDLPILITGESGTGKELAALAIHERSPFAKGPFVAVNAAGLPPTLIASELFGHERGAFTGAVERRIGRIEQANGGTLFLDEIGDLPLDLQAHLLRFLQERTIQRVGGYGEIKVTARVVAATNVDLERAVAEGRFRQDLFFRLDVLRLHLPPLRERDGDVELLARYFIDRIAREFGKAPPPLAEDAVAFIRSYAWPGNVRELISKVRRAMIVADGRAIRASDLCPDVAIQRTAWASGGDTRLQDARDAAQARILEEALRANNFNVTKAARALGVSRVTVYKLMKKYKLYRSAADNS
ncbi:MAG TPA: sigma-54 dependent transcriptional regulator [Alphaproteobacteria bacterium]